MHKNYKPGYGWKKLSGSVFEHTSGARIHTEGLIKMPNGYYYELYRIPLQNEIIRFIRINGENRKRGLMAWASNNIDKYWISLTGREA